MTNEQISKIYQTACDQKLEEFKKAVSGTDPKFSAMAWSFYRTIATNNLDFSLMSEEVQYNRDLRAQNKEANLKWLERWENESNGDGQL
jgi:hypothetical protein